MKINRLDLEKELCNFKEDWRRTCESIDRQIRVLTNRITHLTKEEAIEKSISYSTIPAASATRHYDSWTELEKRNIEEDIDSLVRRRAMMFGRTESAIGYSIARVLKKRGIRVDVVD